MPDPGISSLTERQRRWFASVREGLERETGRSLSDWAALARNCPETAHRARLAWMKTNHGLAQNRASMVLNAAFPPAASWSEPAALERALWSDPAAAALFQQVRALAEALPGVITGQRKGFTAFSRRLQFAAARPHRDGVLLGLALPQSFAPGLLAGERQGWSERLTSLLRLHAESLDEPEVSHLLQAAADRS